MSKYKVLWIDDKWKEIVSFKDVLEKIHGFEVVPCEYAEDGMKIFEEHLEEWSGVILDARGRRNKDSEVEDLSGLSFSVNRINELKSKRFVPYYIITGQPDLTSSSNFAEMYKGHYYEKDKDEDRLIEDFKKNADNLPETRIIHKYQTVFDLWPDSQHDLLRILSVLENQDWQNNSVLNDIRKIMSDVMTRCYQHGVCSVKHDGSNLAECSRMMDEEYMEDEIPIYVRRSMHSCVAITNPGSHRTKTDSDVASGKSPYLIRSLIYDMLNVLYWCQYLPPIEMREVTRGRIRTMKFRFNQSK